FATYYPLADLMRWLGGDPFIQIARYAAVNLYAIEQLTHYGDRLYRVRLRDRVGTEITASRTGAARLGGSVEDKALNEAAARVTRASCQTVRLVLDRIHRAERRDLSTERSRFVYDRTSLRLEEGNRCRSRGVRWRTTPGWIHLPFPTVPA